MTKFAALPGLYSVVFLYGEPLSEIIPAIFAWTFPGTSWFHHQLIPSSDPSYLEVDARSRMAVWQLANCYILLSLISSLILRVARDALPHDLLSQERVVGALLTALAIADISHIAVTWVALPTSIAMDPMSWNSMTHGNITVVVVLFCLRMAWFLGLGRETAEEQGYAPRDSKHRRRTSRGLFKLVDDF